jgi:hypothetical protein
MKLMTFHEISVVYSRLSWSFEVLCRLSLSLLVLSKDDCKILASFKQIQNFKVSHFSMAKVTKVNIAVTYLFKIICLRRTERSSLFIRSINDEKSFIRQVPRLVSLACPVSSSVVAEMTGLTETGRSQVRKNPFAEMTCSKNKKNYLLKFTSKIYINNLSWGLYSTTFCSCD